MYRFYLRAQTQMGESIGLVGGIPELGQWDVQHCIRLQTGPDRYPLWTADVPFPVADSPKIEYRYVRFHGDGSVAWESGHANRWVPAMTATPAAAKLIVEDTWFGQIPTWPYGYWETPPAKLPAAASGLKVVVLGSSVALGCSAWLLNGWANRLADALQNKFGHQLVNVAQIGTNVTTTRERFDQVVPAEQPDIVIIALSLGNEGLVHCPPAERYALQQHFEEGLSKLVQRVRDLGALPILGGVYPHGDYGPEHYRLLKDTQRHLQHWGVPVLDWLDALDDGQGRWQPGLAFEPAHPNSAGHRKMFEAIDLSLFERDKAGIAAEIAQPQAPNEIAVYRNAGFEVWAQPRQKRLRLVNQSPHPYTIRPDWQDLQTALKSKAGLMSGLYIADRPPLAADGSIAPDFWVAADGTIASTLALPPGTEAEYTAARDRYLGPIAAVTAESSSKILFHDGQLGLIQDGDRSLRIINESDNAYNIQPMWKAMRSLLKALPIGVYRDAAAPGAPFRTLIIGPEGLESRVKARPRSSMRLTYHCALADLQRVAIVPLGDRCAVRMLLHKLEYDGPAFPYDLARSTNLADVADMIAHGFEDMWNPALLEYNPEHGRIYHRKWSGLSFAHEVEDHEDPVRDMGPIYARMAQRYRARAMRFRHTLEQADRLLFVRTGVAQRGQVIDLMSKLTQQCQGKPFQLLLLSPQSSHTFSQLPNVVHYDLYFSPDRMPEDPAYWQHCTETMGAILHHMGISSQNLFWCPPNPTPPATQPKQLTGPPPPAQSAQPGTRLPAPMSGPTAQGTEQLDLELAR
jgi:lysophospholipase L1-like esterase